MLLAFFTQYGYASPVLKMFQGGSREAVFFCGKGLPLSFCIPFPSRGQGSLSWKGPPAPPSFFRPIRCTWSCRRKTGPTPGRFSRKPHSALLSPCCTASSLGRAAFAPVSFPRTPAAPPPGKAAAAQRQPPFFNGATKARHRTAKATRARCTGIRARPHVHGTRSSRGAPHRGHKRPGPAPSPRKGRRGRLPRRPERREARSPQRVPAGSRPSPRRRRPQGPRQRPQPRQAWPDSRGRRGEGGCGPV